MNTFTVTVGETLTLLVTPGSLELLALSVAAVIPASPLEPAASMPRLALVVPAHNEGAGIADCIASLRAGMDAEHRADIIVIADNCSDDTAQRAEGAGARVLVRENAHQRGKGYALDFAFKYLLAEGYDGFIVVDADSRVDGNFIAAFQHALATGADALQCRYLALNPEVSLRTRLQHIAWLGFNILRLQGRERLGVSVGILGNGFALSRETLLAVPYDADSIAEDLEYHLRLTRAKRRVRFLATTTVYAAAPTQQRVAATQRARWEGGRLRMIREQVPALLLDVLRGQGQMLEPLAELLLLPLAYHVALLLLLLLIPWPPGQTVASAGLGIVFMHIVLAMRRGRCDRHYVAALLAAPFYIIWKLSLLPRLWRSAAKNAAWERTEREDD